MPPSLSTTLSPYPFKKKKKKNYFSIDCETCSYWFILWMCQGVVTRCWPTGGYVPDWKEGHNALFRWKTQQSIVKHYIHIDWSLTNMSDLKIYYISLSLFLFEFTNVLFLLIIFTIKIFLLIIFTLLKKKKKKKALFLITVLYSWGLNDKTSIVLFLLLSCTRLKYHFMR